jgi:hypothetical protein
MILSILLVMISSFANTNWNVESKLVDKKEAIQVYAVGEKEKKLLMEYVAPDYSMTFKQAEEIYLKSPKKKYLITRWSNGAHGETINIFDPESKTHQQVYGISTIWPAKYIVKSDSVEINVPIENKDGKIKFSATKWKP